MYIHRVELGSCYLFQTIIYDLYLFHIAVFFTGNMVKLGPKLPPPSRRELMRIEKEQRRLAQLESGINLAMIGEPREHLMYLLSTSKRARAKQPDSLAMEESKRRREKTQKRALARRAAKNMMKEIIACVTQG